MLGFEIGQRESGFYSERTESQTDRQTESCQHPVPYYNIDSRNSRLWRDFPRPPGEWRHRRPRWEAAASGGGERKIKNKIRAP